MYFIGVYSNTKNKIKYLDALDQVGTYVFPFIDYQLTFEKWWPPGPSRFIALKTDDKEIYTHKCILLEYIAIQKIK